eukprot:Filipodium_phascolosomae@DN2157_c0_g1_i3.p1
MKNRIQSVGKNLREEPDLEAELSNLLRKFGQDAANNLSHSDTYHSNTEVEVTRSLNDKYHGSSERPRIEFQERTLRVPKICVQEKIVEVPQIQCVQRPFKRIVQIPEVTIIQKERIIEVPEKQIIHKPIPKVVEIPQPPQVVETHLNHFLGGETFLQQRTVVVEVPKLVPRYFPVERIVEIPVDVILHRSTHQVSKSGPANLARLQGTSKKRGHKNQDHISVSGRIRCQWLDIGALFPKEATA